MMLGDTISGVEYDLSMLMVQCKRRRNRVKVIGRQDGQETKDHLVERRCREGGKKQLSNEKLYRHESNLR